MTAQKHKQDPVIFLMGPTAAGKTDAAVYLTEHLDCDIVSVDSAMVYRGLDIGTAKPGPEVLAHAPHRLIDICDPLETYSAGQFRDDALREIKTIHANGRIPLLTGGTMMYFNALVKGLADLPRADAELRQELDQEAAGQGWQYMHQRLTRLDPAAAAKIHPNDGQRIQRALEVVLLTGKPMSELQLQARSENPFDFPCLFIALAPLSKDLLHHRIAARFDQMLDVGLIEEVETLFHRGDLHPDLPALRSVGYRQVWDYLANAITREEMREQGIAATRQLAKRQYTWLRAMGSLVWLDALQDKIHLILKDKVSHFLFSN